MKILFLNAYFYPEKIAFTHLEKDIIEELISLGHEINVICPVPTRGISKETINIYKNLKYQELMNGKLKITRFWAPQERKNVIGRAFRYFWCNFREYQIGKKFKECDLIFSVSTPPTQGMIAGKLSEKLKKPHLYSLQDIFPDSLVNTKITKKNSIIWKIGRKIENYTYKNATKIIVISETMKKNIIQKEVPENKIKIISNWIDLNEVRPINKENNLLLKSLNISINDFIVLYAGNFGAAQGTDIIFKVAKKLENYQNLKFVIFGGGPYFEQAKKEAREAKNIYINELLPLEYISQVYSLGNVALITCKKGTGTAGMPSKTWSIMACNTSIIASFDTESELANILKKSNVGICVEAEDTDELYKAILEEYQIFMKNGAKNINTRKFVKNYASKEICVKKYSDIIESLKS